MDAFDLQALRDRLDLNQTDMAGRMGLSLRAYQDAESGATKPRLIHRLAAERAALSVAVERGNPMLVPAAVRRDAMEIARLISEA